MGAWRTISVALEADTAGYSTDMAKAGQDTAKFGKDVDGAGAKVDELDSKLGRAREGLGLGIAAGTVAGLGLATKAASDLREAQAAANVVFGEGSDTITAFADNAAQAIGLSREEAFKSTATFGNLFTQLGVGGQEAANLSTKMVTLAADFGSFFNEDPTAIIEAQTAAFRGEYDALQRYVPTINAAAVEQRALADTGKANADSLTQQEKALATYALMTEGAGAAVGDFARSSGSAATEAKKAAAETKNAAASMGEALLPVAAKVAETIGFLARQFGKLPGPVQTGVVGLGGMTLAATLLLPKLAETGALLARGGSKAVEFARGIDLASSSNKIALGSMGALALGAAAVAIVLADQAEMAARAQAQVDQLADSVTKGGQSMAEVVDQYLIDTWSEFGANLEDQGLTFEQYRDLVTGSEGDFQAWRESLPNGSDFLGADDGLAGMRLQLEKTKDQVDRYNEAQDKTKQVTTESSSAAGFHKQAVGGVGSAYDHALGYVDRFNEGLVDMYMIGATTVVAFAEALQSTLDVNAAVVDVADAQDRLADAERGLRDAYEAQADASLALADAREGVADAERSLRDAYEGVEDARRGVTEAEEAAVTARENIVIATEELAVAEREAAGDSDAMRNALADVVKAEEALALAQADSLTAQQTLDDARANYGDTLRGLSDDAAGAADDVLSAEIRLRDAQRALADLDKPGEDGVVKPVSADDRLAAQIAVREAGRRLRDAQDRAAEAAADLERNTAGGVEGSDDVVAAREAATEATDNEADAQGRLEEAVLNVAGVQVDANGRVTIAQANLEAAIKDRVDADQRVIDARDAVVDAQDRVTDATRGLRDAHREVDGALRGVRDAQEKVTDQKAEVITARGEVATAEDGVKDAVERQRLKYGELYLVIAYNSQVRTAMRNMTGEARNLVGALLGIDGDFTANVNVNLGGNAADVILSGTSDAFAAILEAVKPKARGGPVKAGYPYLVGEEGPELVTFPADGYVLDAAATRRLGAAPTGATGTMTRSQTPFNVPAMAPGWAQPGTVSPAIDYRALAAALGPRTIHVDAPIDARGIEDAGALASVLSARLGMELSLAGRA